MKQVEVLLPTALDHGFDYRVPDGVSVVPGDIVRVPFGRGESLGVVWAEGTAKLDKAKLKPIISALDFPPLPEAMRAFVRWAAWYNCAPVGAMLKMVLPVDEVDKVLRRKSPLPPPFPPTQEDFHLARLSDVQRLAAQQIENHIGHGFSVTLLDGITGSGKTEVYFDAMAATLASGGVKEKNTSFHDSTTPPLHHSQVLVLLPEIALSVQWLERFEQRFGFLPMVWNSQVTPAKKREAWKAIARGEARVVVGARSALFLPYRNLQLIVVDEEHDSSYKQEDGVVYHARDMAVARARHEKFPVVLVSATPSLESWHNARQGKYNEVSLISRHNQATLPAIAMVDMRQEKIKATQFLSQSLREKLQETLASGHQSMLFLNRRGYAPLMLCRHCGHRFQCAACSSWLVLHQKDIKHPSLGISEENISSNAQSLKPDASLRCHHCNHREPVPAACPECGKEDMFAACGPGVERVLEEVKAFLPNARMAVMASDQLDGYKAMSEVISDMEQKKIDILIGTQMIAKGHHFAGLALVGVVDADLGLAGGDLRAAEKTYQLLHQLSGRAGREQVKGAVYLQSYLPEHPVMQALISGDREAFLQAELTARKNAKMPPFSRLAAVIVEGTKEEQVLKTAKQLASSFTIHHPPSTIHLLGPAPAPLYRLRGKYRMRLLVKADRKVNLPELMKGWVESVAAPSSVRIKIDMDPVGFL